MVFQGVNHVHIFNLRPIMVCLSDDGKSPENKSKIMIRRDRKAPKALSLRHVERIRCVNKRAGLRERVSRPTLAEKKAE